MPPQSLSVFFPMYNERNNIAQTLAQAEAVIPGLGFEDYEIIVVDDGSYDGCDKIVEAQVRQNAHIRLVRHPCNLGYGSALRTGFAEANREAVFYTDSDLPVDLWEVKRALLLLDEADIVAGYRIDRRCTLVRAIYSYIYNWLMRLLFGVQARDVNFSFKLVHRRVLDRIRLTATTVFIDGELLAEARRYGFKVVELPVEYQPRQFGNSNFDSLRVAWDTLAEMVRYWLGPWRD